MRYTRGQPRCTAVALGTALLFGTLAVTASRADANSSGMLMILPTQRLPILRQMNRATNFNVVRVSQVAIGNMGAVMQTAVVDVVQQNQVMNQALPLTLFLLARDVPLVRQLNQGANISVTKIFQAAFSNTGMVAQVAQVNITQHNTSLNQIGPTALLLVFPMRVLPSLTQINRATNINVVRVSQVAVGNAGNVNQIALVSVQQQNEMVNSGQAFPLFVMAKDLPALRVLNVGVNIDVVKVFQVAIGNTGQVSQVALVNVTQDNQALDGV